MTLMTNDLNDTLTNHCILRWRQTMGIILLVVLLYVVPTECTDHTEAYGLKLFESTEWPTLREARIHRNDCLRRHWRRTILNFGDATQAINSAFCRMTRSVYTLCVFQNLNPVGFCVICAFCGELQAKEMLSEE